MMKIRFRLNFSLLIGFLIFWGCSDHIEEKPNIIIFFTDDQGYADVGAYGAEGFETPNFDLLAADGIRFTDFYVPATVCTPSRAGLLTGKYPARMGLHESVIFPYSTHGLDPEEYTMAEMLRDGGYATSCIGKWHLGHQEQFMPNNQGFDSFYGVPYSNDMDGHYYKHNDFQSPPLPFYRDTEQIDEGVDQRYLTTMYTEEAVKQIKGRKDGQPFFIYLAHSMPHNPLFVSEKFEGKSELGLYGDVIMELDWSAGEIIKALKEEGIYDNTLFVFTSDNGPRLGSAKPLRGLKAETWEGGQRVPGIVSWPDKIPGGIVRDNFVSTLDLFPTVAKIVGANNTDDLELDGIDLGSFLANSSSQNTGVRPFFYFARNGDLEAVRKGKWKLHVLKSRGWNLKNQGDFPVSLYNLEEDISEEHNLADKFPQVVDELIINIKNFN